MTTPKTARLPAFVTMISAAGQIRAALQMHRSNERTQLNARDSLRRLQRRLRRAAKTSCDPVEVMEIAHQMKAAVESLILPPDGILALKAVEQDLRATGETERDQLFGPKSSSDDRRPVERLAN